MCSLTFFSEADRPPGYDPVMLGEGMQFAGYTVVRFLGAGGMGEVYLAQHPRLPRRRDALKLLGRAISADGAFRGRFLREADLASTLSHQHIVGVHDRGEDQGQLWIAMDYIEGEDAGQLLRRRYPAGMPAELVTAIITAVASALDYAHSKGLLHRDVKPANIMLSNADDAAQRRILLTDFGIARALDDVSDLTPTNTTLGTVAYSAPEQLMGQELDGRADQYSLAATAYHLLTGTTMFPASNAAVIIGHHLSAEPPALSVARPELAALDPVLRAALAKTRESRFASCTDFARAFAEQARGAAPVPAAPTAPASIPPIASAPPRAKPVASNKAAKAAAAIPAAKPVAAPAVKKSGWKVPAAVAAVSGLAGVALASVVISKLSESRGEIAAPSSSATSTTAPTSSPAIVPTTPVSQVTSSPPRKSSSPRDIDRILLSDAQLSRLVGVRVSEDPASRGGIGGAMGLDSSSYGTADHSGQVTPRSCVGVVFTGEHDAYSGGEIEQIKTQTFGSLYGGSSGSPYLLQQTAVIFPAATEAEAFMERSQNQWDACAANDVDATLGYENSASYALGNVQRYTDLMTVSMATNGGLNGPRACQQAMGVRGNVVVETRTCNVPDIENTYDPAKGWQRNPNWASPIAENIARAMLENIVP